MKWRVAFAVLTWLLLSTIVVQRWPEVKLVLPILPVAIAWPIFLLDQTAAKLVVIATVSVLYGYLAGAAWLGPVVFVGGSLLVGANQALPLAVGKRIIVTVMSVSLLQMAFYGITVGLNTVFVSIWLLQIIIGGLVVWGCTDNSKVVRKHV